MHEWSNSGSRCVGVQLEYLVIVTSGALLLVHHLRTAHEFGFLQLRSYK